MTLQEAVEHKKRIDTCAMHLNMAVSLAASAGLKVEMQLLDVSTLDQQNATMLQVSVLMDPTTLGNSDDQ